VRHLDGLAIGTAEGVVHNGLLKVGGEAVVDPDALGDRVHLELRRSYYRLEGKITTTRLFALALRVLLCKEHAVLDLVEQSRARRVDQGHCDRWVLLFQIGRDPRQRPSRPCRKIYTHIKISFSLLPAAMTTPCSLPPVCLQISGPVPS